MAKEQTPPAAAARTAPAAVAASSENRKEPRTRVFSLHRIEVDGEVFDANKEIDLPTKHLAEAFKNKAIRNLQDARVPTDAGATGPSVKTDDEIKEEEAARMRVAAAESEKREREESEARAKATQLPPSGNSL